MMSILLIVRMQLLFEQFSLLFPKVSLVICGEDILNYICRAQFISNQINVLVVQGFTLDVLGYLRQWQYEMMVLHQK